MQESSRVPRSPPSRIETDDDFETQSESPEKVTPRILEKQIDQLFEDFNKLAETLDLPKIDATTKLSGIAQKAGDDVSCC